VRRAVSVTRHASFGVPTGRLPYVRDLRSPCRVSRRRPTTIAILPIPTAPKPIAPNGTDADVPVRGSAADWASTFATDAGGSTFVATDVPRTASAVVGVSFTAVDDVVVAAGRL
jgi:hypothetical protein